MIKNIIKQNIMTTKYHTPECVGLPTVLFYSCDWQNTLGCSDQLSSLRQQTTEYSSCSTYTTLKILKMLHVVYDYWSAFSALTLLVWHQEEVMRYRCSYLSEAKCILFANDPTDAILKPRHILPHLNPDWYRLTQVVLEKRPLNGCSACSIFTGSIISNCKQTGSKPSFKGFNSAQKVPTVDQRLLQWKHPGNRKIVDWSSGFISYNTLLTTGYPAAELQFSFSVE